MLGQTEKGTVCWRAQQVEQRQHRLARVDYCNRLVVSAELSTLLQCAAAAAAIRCGGRIIESDEREALNGRARVSEVVVEADS